MITMNEKGKLYRNREGEPKKIDIGMVYHNPNMKSQHAENRLPTAYLNGLKLTAQDCRELAEILETFPEEHKELSFYG